MELSLLLDHPILGNDKLCLVHQINLDCSRKQCIEYFSVVKAHTLKLLKSSDQSYERRDLFGAIKFAQHWQNFAMKILLTCSQWE